MLGKEIPCPYCAQLISKDALVCNQCHGNLGIASWAAIRAALIHEPKLANKDPESVNQLHQTAQRIDHDWAEAARKKKEAEELAARQRATAIAEAAEAKRISDASSDRHPGSRSRTAVLPKWPIRVTDGKVARG